MVECTLLSTAVSREMAVEVVTARPRYDQKLGVHSLPLAAFHQEEDGTFLYLLEKNEGLLGGERLRRTPADLLSIEEGRGFTTGLEERGSYVMYASRPLEDEALAAEIDPDDPAPDTYLLWAPAGAELSLEASSSPAAGGRVYLLPQEEASQPFLEEQELAALLPDGEGEGCRLLSLKDGEAFASQLPLLGAAGVLLLVPLACCVGLCFSIGKRGKGKAKALWCLLLAASLTGLYFLLQQVDLPASLMPPETIFDLGYYSETLRLLKEGVAAFSEDLLCSETLTLLRQRGRVALLILAGGGTLLLAGIGAAGLAARKGPGKNG